MSLIKKLKELSLKELENFILRVDKPEYYFPLLIKELEEQFTKVVHAEIKSDQALKSAQKKLARIQTSLDVAKGTLDSDEIAVLLRKALKYEEELSRSEGAKIEAIRVKKDLAAQLKNLRQNKESILAEAREAHKDQELSQHVATRVKGGYSLLVEIAKRKNLQVK